MASRYAPKGKEELYEELCRVITREQGTGEDAWRKAIHLVRRGTASCELVGLTPGATRAIYHWKYGSPPWVSAVPFSADSVQGEDALLLSRGPYALDILSELQLAWVHDDYANQ